MRLALAGDTMLGRGVAGRLAAAGPSSLFSAEVVARAREADLLVLNLECCISTRGEPWPDPFKPFFFRAPPPQAVEALSLLGTSCVTLANNHALDYGEAALLDTIAHLRGAGIAVAGAGADLDEARRPVVLEAAGTRLAVLGVTDHPVAYAATPRGPGVAFADLGRGTPPWLHTAIAEADADAVLLTPHWGPNMTRAPGRALREAAERLLDEGVALIAGHSAHVFHGVAPAVLYDLGDFVDDYRVDPWLRNDLGLLFFVELERGLPVRLEALPLALDYCHTRVARGEDAAWIARRFVAACRALGTEAVREGERLVVDLALVGARGG